MNTTNKATPASEQADPTAAALQAMRFERPTAASIYKHMKVYDLTFSTLGIDFSGFSDEKKIDVSEWLRAGDPLGECRIKVQNAFRAPVAGEALEVDPVTNLTRYEAVPATWDNSGDYSRAKGCAMSLGIRLLPSLMYPNSKRNFAAQILIGTFRGVLEVELPRDSDPGFSLSLPVDTCAGMDVLNWVCEQLRVFHNSGHVEPIAAAVLTHIRACAAAWGGVESLVAGLKKLAAPHDQRPEFQ